MVWPVIVLVLGVGALAALMVAADMGWIRRPPRWLQARSGRPVLVHTVEGASIEGVLLRSDPGGLMLMAAKHLDAKALLPGETWIPARQVLFVQVPDLAPSPD